MYQTLNVNGQQQTHQKDVNQTNKCKIFDIGDGRIVTIETGKLAKQADGSVVVRMGDAMLLATVVATQKPKEGADFLRSLLLSYQEKFRICGSFSGWFFQKRIKFIRI